MGINKNIKEEIQSTFETLDQIQEIKTPPFFKEKTMRKLFEAEIEEEKVGWTWFTPKLQLATLIGLIVLNVFAFSQLKSSNYDKNVSNFAEIYGLTTNSETSILNQ